jgi:UDP-N-acetylmuramoyl-tripeptide--D-alanyl-D-alanine ligase
MTIPELYQLYTKHRRVDTDTRAIRKGSLFFALKGDRFDGNQFASEALEKGASFAVIDNPEYQAGSRTILVKDALKALQQLATFHRKQLGIPILALTGSNGKTTTKELINRVLAGRYKTSATRGNLNNHIGVPLTLLSMNQHTEIGIVEMGANHPGEIAALCRIARPSIGLITNFGKAHLEGFGSVEGVIEAKSELYDFLRDNHGLAFVNADDAVQLKKTEGIERILFNKKTIPFLGADPFVVLKFHDQVLKTQLVGAYNYGNLAAALTIGDHFEIPIELAGKAVITYTPSNNRSQVISRKNLKIILDAYNANPTSMTAALKTFIKMKDRPKTIILGDMFELGETSAREHQAIAALATSSGFERVILIGNAFSTVKIKNALLFKSFEAFQASKTLGSPRGLLLIKGSRGMRLERILDLLPS